MYNATSSTELSNPEHRAALRSYLRCAKASYIIYGVVQIFGILASASSKTNIVDGNIIIAGFLLFGIFGGSYLSKHLQDPEFDCTKFKKFLKFTICMNWVVVIVNLATVGMLGLLIMFKFAHTDKAQYFYKIFAEVCVVNLSVIVPFFWLLRSHKKIRAAIEAFCGAELPQEGRGSFGAEVEKLNSDESPFQP